MAEQGRILYAVEHGHWVFRFEGNIRYTMAHPLDVFLDKVFADSRPAAVTADLRDTVSIDSTGVGLLAKIAQLARAGGSARPLLFCDDADVAEILDSVCLDRAFTIVSGALPERDFARLPATAPSHDELAGTIEGAHRLLCELSEDNRARFEGVLEAFSRMRAKP